MDSTAKIALEIGTTIRDARVGKGYKSRADFVKTKGMKGTLTQEGLRKIENGERVPRLETLRTLSETLGINKKRTKEMEDMALEANIKRVVRRAGNVPVTFRIEGKPVRVSALPPKRKAEAFARELVEELTKMVDRYGVLQEDLHHFRRHARHSILKRLDP